jgi:hypothetical protein
MVEAVPPEGRNDAVFGLRSVRGSGGRPAMVAAGLALALGSLVLMGLVQSRADRGVRMAAISSPRATWSGTAPVIPPRFLEPLTGPSAGDSALMTLDVQPDGRHLLVRGDVFSERIRVIVVSLRDASGKTADIRTLKLPRGSTSRHGLVNRFDLLFDRPGSMRGAITVQASGYDAADDRIVSVQASAAAAR